MSEQKFSRAGDSLLVSIGYGDSVGLPVETKKRTYIAENYGEIRGLGPINNPFMGEVAAGTWSDDTQLSLAVADSLIDAKEFSLESMAEQHVKAMEETPIRQWHGQDIPRGWGKSTWESITKIKNGLSGPLDSGSKEGEGNGVLMKLAPLAFWQAVTCPEDVYEHIELLARMTHNNDLSVVTALTHNEIMADLLLETINSNNLIETALEYAKTFERQYRKAGNITSKILGKLANKLDLTPEYITEIAPKGGFHSPETLVMAYGAFALEQRFPESVYTAVNLGGDTDSIGSIVASMSVMQQGRVDRPHDIDQLSDMSRLRTTGRTLARLSLSQAK